MYFLRLQTIAENLVAVTVLEARSLEEGVLWAMLPPKATGSIFPASPNFWWLRRPWLVATSLQPCSIFTRLFPVCLCLFLLFSHKQDLSLD